MDRNIFVSLPQEVQEAIASLEAQVQLLEEIIENQESWLRVREKQVTDLEHSRSQLLRLHQLEKELLEMREHRISYLECKLKEYRGF